ncbi:hypothetical protein OIU74_019445 [Salix koriyanagi]|uniref:Uncharacterized protein n=1 Tax=Salix koriyanagi TaxID=2511006 RepID=A0A9Q0P3N0_9ROSI|nr:hypothetical protein OIU74_019445 [Salix koriyanagi]
MDFLVRLGSFRTLAVQGYTDRDRQVTNQHIRREGRHLANLGPLLFVSLWVSVFWANDRVEPKLDLRVKLKPGRVGFQIVGPISNELYSVSVFSWPVGKHKSTAR